MIWIIIMGLIYVLALIWNSVTDDKDARLFSALLSAFSIVIFVALLSSYCNRNVPSAKSVYEGKTMREIKFRGKSKKDGEWCYGAYIYNNPLRMMIRPFWEIHTIVFWHGGDWGWVCEKVIPETIGQYTGLKDKNEKEIYEGDIILWHNKKYVVKFQSGMFYASVEEFNEGVHGGYPLWSLVKYHDEQDRGVIVGNIYENNEEKQ